MQPTNFRIEKSGLLTKLFSGETLIGTFQASKMAEDDRLEVFDDITEIEPGLFEWQRKFIAFRPVSNARPTLDFSVAQLVEFALIPAVSYNGNPWGPGHEIKGFSFEEKPWTVAYHRVAVSGGTYSESRDWSVSLWAGEGFRGSCALVPDAHKATDRVSEGKEIGDKTNIRLAHRLIVPQEETPYVYALRDEFSAPYIETLDLEKGQIVVIRAYLLVQQNQEPRSGWHRMLDAAWRQHNYTHQPRHTGEDLWRWGLEYATNGLWSEEGIFKGFCIGMQWSAEEKIWVPNQNIYEIGWCGQNASLANALLADYLRNDNQASLDRGLAVLDAWAEYAPLPNGLFRCHFNWILRPSNLDTSSEVQDGCNLGAAATYFFEAAELAQRCGVDRTRYRTIALAICNFFVNNQFSDGNLGRAWTNAGECVAMDGQTGGFLIPPLLIAYQLTGQENYLVTARRAFDFYFQNLTDNGFTAAGALDTHCIDKESAIPLLKSSLLLYDITAKPRYLKKAEQAAYYLSSWQWHHTVPYPEGTALNKLNYDTFGGTAVSTQHHHQDPYGLVYVLDLLKLATLTNKPFWKERAQALWANGMIGVSDGQLEIMGKLQPTGSQDEGFYHTRWGHWPFNTSQWLVAWPTAFRLEVLRKLTDWSILE